MTRITRRFPAANPLLYIVTGLCPILIPSFTLQNGMILGFGVAAHAIVLAALVPVLSRLTNDSLRFYLSLAVSGIVATLYGLGIRALFPAESYGLSPFLALLALNCFGLSVLRSSLRQEGLERLPEFARSAAILFLSLIVFAALRELLGSGMVTLYSRESAAAVLDLRSVLKFPIRMALLPSGAFLLLGYGCALYRLRGKRRKD